MRKYFTPLLVCLSFTVYGQNYSYLDFNNVKALVSDGGVFFLNASSLTPGYEVPNGSGNHAIYSMGFWIAGKDESSNPKGACQTYFDQVDFAAGPISDDYNSTYYTDNFLSCVWTVTAADIAYHQANYTSGGYVPSASIANWPGNGNTSEGVAQQLAPYVDVNGDYVYDPMDGDYPFIQGGKAAYVILNDENVVHQATGSSPMGIELHVMFYQLASNDDLNNTVFMNAKLYNRRDTNYTDLAFGMFSDFDLGSFNDDYVGCDSVRNIMYVYNSTNSDPGGGGQPGYGANPPAVGIMSLNKDISSFVSYSNMTGPTGDPTNIYEYYNYLQGYWSDGSPMYAPSGYITKYLYTGNPNGSGWSEVSEGNPAGDRRGLMSVSTNSFNSGDELCLDLAIIYNRASGNNFENAEGLAGVADFIQNYYDNNLQPCSNITVGLPVPESVDILVYPNPSNGSIQIELLGDFQIEVYNLNGSIVYAEQMQEGVNQVNIDVESGMYILKVVCGNIVYTKRIEVIR